MTTKIVLDIETVSIDSEQLEDYKARFEPKPPEPEPGPEIEEGSKKRRSKTKKTVSSVVDRKRKLKSDRPGLHWLVGKLVCVGLKPIGKPAEMYCNEDEELVLTMLYEGLLEKRPIDLITFNGKAFDIPFINMRGLVHGLDFTHMLPNDRYSKMHLDLFETIGGKWNSNARLSELCWMFGIDCIEGEGNQMQKLYDQGDLEGIVNHCRGDVEATEQLYLKMFPPSRAASRKYN